MELHSELVHHPTDVILCKGTMHEVSEDAMTVGSSIRDVDIYGGLINYSVHRNMTGG